MAKAKKKPTPAPSRPLAGVAVAFVGKFGYGDMNRGLYQSWAKAAGAKVVDPAKSKPALLVVGEGRGGHPPGDVAKLEKKYPGLETTDLTGLAKRVAPGRDELLADIRAGRMGDRWDDLEQQARLAGVAVDLSKADLRGQELFGAHLEHATLDGADLREAKLQYAHLPPLTKVTLDAAEAENVYLSDLTGCSFRGANLGDAWFFFGHVNRPVATVEGCDFTGAKLAEARLEPSGYLGATRVVGCKFREADLTDAHLARTTFDGADFTKADLSRVHASKATFARTVFAKATLRRADLREAKLAGADLRNADLREAVLSGADLSGASVAGADFKDAVLTGANLTGVDTSKAKNFRPPVVRTPGPRLADLAAAFAGADRFQTTAMIDLNEDEHALLRLSAWGGALSADYRHVRGTGPWMTNTSDGIAAPTVEQGLLNLADRWPNATLRLDTVTAKGSKTARGKQLVALAAAAWAEAFGVTPAAGQDLDALRDAQKAGAVEKKAKLIADLRANGPAAWNDLGYQEKDRYGDLGAVDLSGAKLPGIDLYGRDLRGAKLTGAKLKGARLWSGKLQGADFTGADLAKADLQGSKCGEAVFERAKLASANLSGADFTKANLRGADLAKADLKKAKLQGADLSGATLTGADLDDTEYDDATVLPAGFTPPGIMCWKGTPKPAAPVTPGSLDFPTFVKRLGEKTDPGRLANAKSMLRAEKFELFADVTADAVVGVVRSQSSGDRVYACTLGADGRFGCGTQNLRPCGGLGGKVCKHLLVLVVGLAKAGKLDPATAAAWLDSSRARSPAFDQEAASETFLRYKGAEAGEIDWRPTETIPEDFYAM